MSKLIDIISRTFENGNPLKTVINNTSSVSISQLLAADSHDIISIAFGKDLADALVSDGRINTADNNPISGALFKLQCALRVKNQDLLAHPELYHLPIRFQQHYCCIDALAVNRGYIDMDSMINGNTFPGIDFIRRVGMPFVPEGVYAQRLQAAYARLDEVDHHEVLRILQEAAASKGINDLLVFDYRESYPCYQHRNWLNAAYDVYLDSLDVYDICKFIEATLLQQGCVGGVEVKPCEVLGEQGFSVCFENDKAEDFRRILIHPTKGVFEGSRHRRFTGALLVNDMTSADVITDTVPREDIHLLSSYNVFITWLLRFGTKFIADGGAGLATKQFGLFFDKYLVNEEVTACPLTSIDEQGAPDGDRQELEFTSAKVRTIKDTDGCWFPFTLEPNYDGSNYFYRLATVDTADLTANIANPYKVAEFVDGQAFFKYNLVRMVTNGSFVDGRMSVLRMKDVPEEHRSFVIQQAERFYGNIYDWAAKNNVGFSDKDLMAYLGKNLTLALSSKQTKFNKRATMDKAVIAKVLNGESRGSINWGQMDESFNNICVPACVSMSLIGAAGNAYYWEEDGELDLGTALVQKRVKNNPEILPVVINRQIKFSTSGQYELGYDAGWTVLTFKDYVVGKGTEIIEFPYTEGVGEYGYAILSQFEGAVVSEVRFRLANNAGKRQGLNVETTYINHESAFKARNYIKAVMVPYQRSILHNGLNGEEFYARALFPSDTIKSADLVKAHFDLIAATYNKNRNHPHCARGYAMLREANNAVGCCNYTPAVWSPVAAWGGLYEDLLAQFDADFGRAMWSTWREETPEWTLILKKLMVSDNGTYRKGWNLVDFNTLTEFTFMHPGIDMDTVRCYADGDVSNPKTNIVVIGQGNSGVHFFAQRGWAWVGTQDCPVYQPIKCEVSTVTENVGYSSVMMGVVRNVARRCAKTARTLTILGDRRQQLSAALHLMGQAKSAKGYARVPVLDQMYVSPHAAPLLHTAELRELVLDPSNKGRVLGLLAERLTKPFFYFNFVNPAGGQTHFTLNLAAIVAQDANTDFASEDSLSALVEQLFIALILAGEEAVDPRVILLISRVYGKLAKLVNNEGLNKAGAFAARSLGARAAGIPGIPCGEVWIPMSNDPRSVYRKWINGFKHIHKDLDCGEGCLVLTYRAPMTEPIFQRVVIIAANDPRHKMLSAYTLNMNPIVNNIHGGDYDGDTYQMSPAVFWEAGSFHEANIATTTVQDVIRVVLLRTGSDQFVDDSGNAGGSYYADHNEIKLKKVGPSSKNLMLMDTVAFNLTRATECQFKIVGQIHRVVLLSDLYVNLQKDLKSFGVLAKDYARKPHPVDAHEKIMQSGYRELEINNAFELDNLIMSLYEIYEVPLGGYDAAAFEAISTILGVAQSGEVEVGNLSALANQMAEAGMNASLAMPVVEMAMTVCAINDYPRRTYYSRQLKNIWHKFDAPSMMEGLDQFLLATAMMSYRISKGDFIPAVAGDEVNSAYKMADDWIKFVLKEENKAILDNLDNSTVLLPLKRFIKTTFAAVANDGCEIAFNTLLTGVPDFNEGDASDDDTDEGGGNVPTDPTPNPSNNGGNVMPEAISPVVKETSAVGSEDADLNAEDYSFAYIAEVWDWFVQLPEKVQQLGEWKKLSADQAVAVQRVACGQYNCVTVLGRAGSGKTFIMKFIQKVLGLLGNESYICGSTGAATAISDGAGTIYSFAGINIGNVLPEGMQELLPGDCSDKPRATMIQAAQKARSFISGKPGPDLVIMIDEFSMLSAENLVLIYQSFRRVVRKNRKIRFVVFGDFRQLLFINNNREFKLIKKHAQFAFKRAKFTTYRDNAEPKETTYEYGSLLTNEGPFRIDGDDFNREPWKTECISLITNHRQNTGDESGAEFVEALNALGDGADFNDPRLKCLMSRVFTLNDQGKFQNMVTHELAPTNLSNGLNLFTWNNEIKAHNEKVEAFARRENPPCRTYTAVIRENHLTEKQILGEVRPIPKTQSVFVGQKIMFRKNTNMPGLVNGSICEVTSVESKSIGLKVLATGDEYNVEKMDFPISETKHGVGGSFSTCAMFHSAYGMTPWKVQGTTVKAAAGSDNRDAVVLNLNRREATHGLLYVSCSRVETIDQLYILARDFNTLNRSVHCNPEIKEFIALAENNTQHILSGNETEEATQQVVAELAQVTLGKKGHAVCGVRYDGRYYVVGYSPLGQYNCQPAFLKMQMVGNNFADVDTDTYHELYKILILCSQGAAKDLLDTVNK